METRQPQKIPLRLPGATPARDARRRPPERLGAAEGFESHGIMNHKEL